jgi:hypothetical protein
VTGELHRFVDRQGRFVNVTCYDVATDWVPLYDAQVVKSGEVVEYIDNIRGFTGVMALARGRGWEPRCKGDGVRAPLLVSREGGGRAASRTPLSASPDSERDRRKLRSRAASPGLATGGEGDRPPGP